MSSQSAPSDRTATLSGGSAPALNGELLNTLAGMLREHFVEEVRRRDHDRDGRLSRREYGGSPDEFQELDADRDGYIGAGDLVRGALARNERLSDLITGPWSGVYDGFLSLESPSAEDLEDLAITLCLELKLDSEKFFHQHPDLLSLHSRLNELADRLGRHRRYHPVDLSL